jgi:iron(III) transport system substrate-binding protein
MTDPNGGAGLGTLTTLYVAFGEDYVRDLLSRQDVVVTGDNRQLAEWVIRGRYPIGIGIASEDLVTFEREGLSFNVKGVTPARKLSLGFGGIQLVNRAPNPNAAKVFVNWLLTQKVQERLVKSLEINSRRVDVPAGDRSQVLDPGQLSAYVPHQYEEYLPQRQRAQQMGKDLLAK